MTISTLSIENFKQTVVIPTSYLIIAIKNQSTAITCRKKIENVVRKKIKYMKRKLESQGQPKLKSTKGYVF